MAAVALLAGVNATVLDDLARLAVWAVHGELLACVSTFLTSLTITLHLYPSLIPTINVMMVVGLVSLPGIFTGQVLSGIDPLNAASYQILIVLAIAATIMISTPLVTAGIYRKFFNSDAQLTLT